MCAPVTTVQWAKIYTSKFFHKYLCSFKGHRWFHSFINKACHTYHYTSKLRKSITLSSTFFSSISITLRHLFLSIFLLNLLLCFENIHSDLISAKVERYFSKIIHRLLHRNNLSLTLKSTIFLLGFSKILIHLALSEQFPKKYPPSPLSQSATQLIIHFCFCSHQSVQNPLNVYSLLLNSFQKSVKTKRKLSIISIISKNASTQQN